MSGSGDDDVLPVRGRNVAIVNWRDPWHPDAGGAERYAWEMAQGLLRRGARVSYVTARAPGQSGREHRDGVPIIRLGGRLTVYPAVLAWVLVHRRSFDAVIDCQNGIPFFTPWVLPRRVPVLCVMHHVHDDQFGVHFGPLAAAVGRLLEGPVARWCYRRQECVAVSQSTVDAMRRRLGWAGPIHIVPNGVAPDAFVSPPGVATDDARPGELVLTWVGRLVAHKRVERVLDIADHLNQDRLGSGPVTIQVIGRGPEVESLTAAVVARGLDGRVGLRGYLPEADKRTVVAASTLHLNTSQGEGWGLCVLEAAALGVPTVAYDVDGLRDAVRDGETGWLVRDGEQIEDVTERALKELADPARQAAIASACRAWASQFDWDHSAGMLAGLIGSALLRTGARGRRDAHVP
jgi:glycosyltransferase involved in cell wall biosynthesis